jgi:hypothetical protein
VQAHFSTGAVAASFTSTVMPVNTVHEAAILDEDYVRYERIKKKGEKVFPSILFGHDWASRLT